MRPKDFVRSAAALRRDGEEEDGQPYEMSIDDAIETLSWLIVEARAILGQDFEGRKLEAAFDPMHASAANMSNILAAARQRHQAGAVAHHLVGAALALCHPELSIENATYNKADDRLDRSGDFHVGDTALYVTVSPTPNHYENCKRNLDEGLRAYLLVPDPSVVGARQNANDTVPGRIAVGSIESFVAQNVEEMSEFSTDRLRHGFRRLLETYNQRVKESETDPSLLIEIPDNLAAG